MKREVRALLSRATDSLFLSIDHFNRPLDRGRPEAVLIFLDRAFELLLKAIIIHRGGRIRERSVSQTMGFERCVRKCLTEAPIKCLTEEQAFTIQTINGQRDAAQHYIISMSEQLLYLHAQAGLTLFDTVLHTVFGQRVSEHFPTRVLPITTSPPRDLAAVITAEFEDILALVAPGSRKRLEALARLRAIAVIERSLGGEQAQPSPRELQAHVRKVVAGTKWTELFPGVASLRLDTTGTGLQVSLRITKALGEPIRLVKEDAPNATIVGVKRVNDLDFYTLGLTQLAEKLSLSQNMTLAVVRKLGLQEDADYFKVFRIGASKYKRYSKKALDRLNEELQTLDLEEVWREYNPVAWQRRGGATY